MHEDEKKLADVHPEETFKVESGKEIKNLKQLLHVLDEISPGSFKHHVNESKNDFANWIRNSVGDAELADLMEKTTDIDETKKLLRDRVELLEKKIEVRRIKESLEGLKSSPQPAPEQPADAKAGEAKKELHPFEHLKHSVNQTIRDIALGLIAGFIIGFLIGKSF